MIIRSLFLRDFLVATGPQGAFHPQKSGIRIRSDSGRCQCVFDAPDLHLSPVFVRLGKS